MTCAGIHFGNTNSVISVFKDGKIFTVSNETGDRVTPTVVAYTGNEKIVGQPAKNFMVRNPQCCVSNIKATIGQSFSEEHIKQIQNKCSCDIFNEHGTIYFKVEVEEKEVTLAPIKAASYVFTKLLENAEGIGGEDLEDAVICVPKDFSEERRIALREAAEDVGFNILRLISEPAAALLAYGIGQDDPMLACRVLVFRLGGTSMTVSIVRVNSGIYCIEAEKTDNDFGAEQFNKSTARMCLSDIEKKLDANISKSRKAMGKLESAIETAKIGLCNSQKIAIHVDALYDGMDYNYQLNRPKFEDVCSNDFQKCNRFVESVLQENSLCPNDISKVVLVGGGCSMPRLQQLLKGKFSQSEVLHSINPTEVLAEGAAAQAGLLLGQDDLSAEPVFDCTSVNLGLLCFKEDGSSYTDVFIECFTPVPTRRVKDFILPENQTSLVLKIVESNMKQDGGDKLLAKLVMRDLPPDSVKEFKCTFEIDRERKLTVSLFEKKLNRTEQISIATGVT